MNWLDSILGLLGSTDASNPEIETDAKKQADRNKGLSSGGSQNYGSGGGGGQYWSMAHGLQAGQRDNLGMLQSDASRLLSMMNANTYRPHQFQNYQQFAQATPQGFQNPVVQSMVSSGVGNTGPRQALVNEYQRKIPYGFDNPYIQALLRGGQL